MDICDGVENGGEGVVNNKVGDMGRRQIMKGFYEKQRGFTFMPKDNRDLLMLRSNEIRKITLAALA